jgi:hypothetical protein
MLPSVSLHNKEYEKGSIYVYIHSCVSSLWMVTLVSNSHLDLYQVDRLITILFCRTTILLSASSDDKLSRETFYLVESFLVTVEAMDTSFLLRGRRTNLKTNIATVDLFMSFCQTFNTCVL